MAKIPISIEQLKSRLTEENLISPERFVELQNEAERKNQDLAEILVSEGILSQNYLYEFFASALGVPLADLKSKELDKQVVGLLPKEVAREREVIIFGKEENGSLSAAMADPSDLSTVEYLNQNLHARIRAYLATPEDLERGYAVYGEELASSFRETIEKNIQESLRNQTKSEAEAASEVPIVEAVENLLSYAISLRASDVHLEALEEDTLIRYRIDGILFEIMRIPKSVHPSLVARIKLLAGLKIDEHYAPQDGRFRFKVGKEVVDVRVAVMPTYFGEKIVMRLLEAAQKPLSLEEIGMLPTVAKKVDENLKKAFGMILTCGPTGSGKTTTLYALMNILNTPTVNIATIEDPIEYNMRYINQSQVNTEGGVTFASGLRSLLRQDPNIIMVGEIRDGDTANISVQASLTGHLLLSSLHTNDAPTAVPRLIDLDVPPFLVASTLNLIIAQRLVRKICPSCIYSYAPDAEFEKSVKEQFEHLGIPSENYKLPKVLYRGKGCKSCGGIGYRGRIGIFEVMEITDALKRVVMSPQFNLDNLKQEARKDKMETMFEDGLKKVELAITTIEEVLRVTQE